MISTNLIMVTIPDYVQKSIDLISSNNPASSQSELLKYIQIMLLLGIGVIIVRTLSRIFFFNPGRAIEYQIKNDLFSRLTQLQRTYYEENPSGDIISRLNNDITGVRLLCGFVIMQFFNIITSLSFTPYKMWLLSPRLTIYCAVPVLLIFIMVQFSMKVMVKNTKKRMKGLQDISSFIVNMLSGIDLIKSNAMQNWVRSRYDKSNQDILDYSINIAVVRAFFMPLLLNLENFLKIIILLFGSYYVFQEDFTIGELTAYITYSALLVMPLMGMGWFINLLQQGLVGLDSIQTIISQKSVTDEKTIEYKKSEKGITLEVKKLSFSYAGEEQKVLKDINFTITPGETVGILGRIGSGKTTLVNCLNRYLDIQTGQVFIDQQDIRKMNFQDLRQSIRTVSQDTFLFSDSVENNILFGIEEGNEDKSKLEEAIHLSCLAEEIERFPEHEQTMVGEKGIMLSGGQKQRLSIARSLMAPCNLLILDNIFSAVDYETERSLISKIYQNKNASSLLIVSHRVSALERADKILVFDNGKIIDQGTHDQLIKKEGYYKETWELQNTNQ